MNDLQDKSENPNNKLASYIVDIIDNEDFPYGTTILHNKPGYIVEKYLYLHFLNKHFDLGYQGKILNSLIEYGILVTESHASFMCTQAAINKALTLIYLDNGNIEQAVKLIDTEFVYDNFHNFNEDVEELTVFNRERINYAKYYRAQGIVEVAMHYLKNSDPENFGKTILTADSKYTMFIARSLYSKAKKLDFQDPNRNIIVKQIDTLSREDDQMSEIEFFLEDLLKENSKEFFFSGQTKDLNCLQAWDNRENEKFDIMDYITAALNIATKEFFINQENVILEILHEATTFYLNYLEENLDDDGDLKFALVNLKDGFFDLNYALFEGFNMNEVFRWTYFKEIYAKLRLNIAKAYYDFGKFIEFHDFVRNEGFSNIELIELVKQIELGDDNYGFLNFR